MPIRWDSLLVRHLASELDAALAGRSIRAIRLDGASRDLVVFLKTSSLAWRLHPERGQLRLGEAVDPSAGDLRLRARIRGVAAPEDDRIVRFELFPDSGPAPLELVVELIGNRWNAVVTEGPERTVRHLLTRRERPRLLAVGHPYVDPEPTARAGVAGDLEVEEWREILGPVAPPARERALVRAVAWTSPLNAATILGSAAEDDAADALDAALARWRVLALGTSADPVLLDPLDDPQPYPVPLTGVTLRRVDSLLAGFETGWDEARRRGDAAISLELGPELVSRLEEAVRHEERRVARLRAELDGLEDPARLRRVGDLILARFAEVGRGRAEVALTDFHGEEVRVALDPALAPHENAERYYDRAARSERARERLPGLVDEAERALRRLVRLRERAVDGEADADEVREALPRRAVSKRGTATTGSLPYRSYRSSGGLEIRVGRGARHNDDLTFRHSAPGDVWMHARHAAGAHVVLRWSGEGAPPARDLSEAAALAALHSRARTSGSVPVDWTYRRYVRKPRGSPPGRVAPDRVRTLFVEPDEALAEALREPSSADEPG